MISVTSWRQGSQRKNPDGQKVNFFNANPASEMLITFEYRHRAVPYEARYAMSVGRKAARAVIWTSAKATHPATSARVFQQDSHSTLPRQKILETPLSL
jgi:hypothetical protein